MNRPSPIRNLISSFVHFNADKLQDAVENSRFVVNRTLLPEGLSRDTLTKVFNDAVVGLDDYFDEKSFVMVNIKRLAQLPERIITFSEVFDKKGNWFFEVVLKNCM